MYEKIIEEYEKWPWDGKWKIQIIVNGEVNHFIYVKTKLLLDDGDNSTIGNDSRSGAMSLKTML